MFRVAEKVWGVAVSARGYRFFRLEEVTIKTDDAQLVRGRKREIAGPKMTSGGPCCIVHLYGCIHIKSIIIPVLNLTFFFVSFQTVEDIYLSIRWLDKSCR